jgi:hypothetical protein
MFSFFFNMLPWYFVLLSMHVFEVLRKFKRFLLHCDCGGTESPEGLKYRYFNTIIG